MGSPPDFSRLAGMGSVNFRGTALSGFQRETCSLSGTCGAKILCSAGSLHIGARGVRSFLGFGMVHEANLTNCAPEFDWESGAFAKQCPINKARRLLTSYFGILWRSALLALL
jgi:hypothetical protein